MPGKDRHTDPSDAAFEDRLREVRQQKARIEEEHEEASERWRKERRRLNDEVDRLEQALQKTRLSARSARKSDDSDQSKLQGQLDQAATQKAQAEQTLIQERSHWERQRKALEEKVAGLETRLVEVLERSSNPVRSGDARSVPQELEFEGRIKQIKTDASKQMQAALIEWDAERAKLHLEVDRLKQAALSRPAVAEPTRVPSADAKPSRGWLADKLLPKGDLAALEAQLAEAERSRKELESQLQHWETDRSGLQGRIDELTSALGAAPEAPSDAGVLEELSHTRTRLQLVETQLQESLGTLEASEAAWGEQREALEASVRAMESALEEANRTVAESGERDQQWAAEGRELEARLAAAEDSLAKADANTRASKDSEQDWNSQRAAFEAKLDETGLALKDAEVRQAVQQEALDQSAAEVDALKRQLGDARSEWAAERDALEQKVAAAGQSSIEAAESAASAENEWARERQSLEEQRASARQMVAEAEASQLRGSDKAEELTAELMAARESLRQSAIDREAREAAEADLKGQIGDLTQVVESRAGRIDELEARATSAEARSQQVSEAREALERSLEAAAAEHEAERESLEARVAQLKEAAEAGASRIDSAELDAVRSEFLSRLGKVEGERDQLARLRDQAAAEWDAEKAELAGAVKEARGQQAADAEKFEGELKEKLTLEFRIKDLELEKERLEARIAATANPGSGSLGMMLDEEITTVDRKIAEIARFIDDPESPLSSVIRKNVERSELEAYRRGLDFRLEMVRKSGSE